MAQKTKLEQIKSQVHTLLHDEENPVARLFAQLEGICRVPRLYLFLGKRTTEVECCVCVAYSQLS